MKKAITTCAILLLTATTINSVMIMMVGMINTKFVSELWATTTYVSWAVGIATIIIHDRHMDEKLF
jgi:hypothetical protein